MPLNVHDLSITAGEYEPGARIPDTLTADDANAAPTFTVTGVPSGAVELALVVHDPDAPLPRGFTHWVVYGLPAEDGLLDASAARSAINDTGETGWFGPQPPHGHGDHHYYAWVYALSRPVDGEPTRAEFLDAYADAILEQNRVIGTFSR